MARKSPSTARAVWSGYIEAMVQRVKRWMGVLLVGVIVAYLSAVGLIWWQQEAMIFPAPGGIGRGSLDQAADELGAEPIDLVASDGTKLYGWYRSGGGQRAVLYFHGNAETVAGTGQLMRQANQAGWDFATVAYRGYPGSEGHPTEEGVVMDAQALFEHVQGRGIAADQIVLHGRSLGGGVAVSLSERVSPGGLVLESTYLSVLTLAERQVPWAPVEQLLRHPFRTDLRAPNVTLPTLVLHGSADPVIPVQHGRALSIIVKGADYVEVDGAGHQYQLTVIDRAARTAWLELLGKVAEGPAER